MSYSLTVCSSYTQPDGGSVAPVPRLLCHVEEETVNMPVSLRALKCVTSSRGSQRQLLRVSFTGTLRRSCSPGAPLQHAARVTDRFYAPRRVLATSSDSQWSRGTSSMSCKDMMSQRMVWVDLEASCTHLLMVRLSLCLCSGLIPPWPNFTWIMCR